MKKFQFSAIAGALFVAALAANTLAVAQSTEPTAAQRARAAGHEVSEEAEKAYDASEQAVKNGYRATKRGTKKAYHATKRTAKKAGGAMSDAGHTAAGGMRKAGHAVGEKIPGTMDHDMAKKP